MELTFSQLQQKMQLKKEKKGGVSYAFRNAEDIYTAFKELKSDWAVIVNDELVSFNDKLFVKATATAFKDDEKYNSYAYAELSSVPVLNTRKGQMKQMQEPQWTGAVSSYARKYALQGLFAIGEKDVDSYHVEETTNDNQATSKQYISAEKVDEYNNEIQKLVAKTGKDDGSIMRAVLTKANVTLIKNITTDKVEMVDNLIERMKKKAGI